MSESGKTKATDEGAQGDAKKIKANDEEAISHPIWESLEPFKFVKILRADAQSKMVCVHAKSQLKSISSTDFVGSSDTNGSTEADAVILMEKAAFHSTSSAMEQLLSLHTTTKQLVSNDIYGTYESLPPADANCEYEIAFFVGIYKG